MREAEVSVADHEFATMGIEDLVDIGREAGLVEMDELTCNGRGGVVQAEVETRMDEQRLDALSFVDSWEHVAELAETHVYVVAFTAPDLPDSLSDQATDLVGTCDPDLDESGATMSFVGPQDVIAEQLDEYEQAGVSPDLRRLGGYRGPDRPMEDLTERQREVLQTAYDMGYYEVPSQATTEEIAAELDLDPSTVAEHLQRAEKNLLSHHL